MMVGGNGSKVVFIVIITTTPYRASRSPRDHQVSVSHADAMHANQDDEDDEA